MSYNREAMILTSLCLLMMMGGLSSAETPKFPVPPSTVSIQYVRDRDPWTSFAGAVREALLADDEFHARMTEGLLTSGEVERFLIPSVSEEGEVSVDLITGIVGAFDETVEPMLDESQLDWFRGRMTGTVAYQKRRMLKLYRGTPVGAFRAYVCEDRLDALTILFERAGFPFPERPVGPTVQAVVRQLFTSGDRSDQVPSGPQTLEEKDGGDIGEWAYVNITSVAPDRVLSVVGFIRGNVYVEIRVNNRKAEHGQIINHPMTDEQKARAIELLRAVDGYLLERAAEREGREHPATVPAE